MEKQAYPLLVLAPTSPVNSCNRLPEDIFAVSTVRSVSEHNSQGKSDQRPKKGCNNHDIEGGRTLDAGKQEGDIRHTQRPYD